MFYNNAHLMDAFPGQTGKPATERQIIVDFSEAKKMTKWQLGHV